ncbi:MAG: hypothetical protein KF704_02665 [Crocinitomicaceae bacterium]|nr:hypothetical protein [Crocinitomicaceae bacterium]
MSNFYMSLIFISFFQLLNGQIPNTSLENLTVGVHEGHDYAQIKLLHSDDLHVKKFQLQMKTTPDPEFKNAQLQRYQAIPGFISLKEEQNEAVIITRLDVELDHLQHILLHISRLYGYVGFKLSLLG